MENLLFKKVADLLALNDNSAKALARLGIHNIRDLLFYTPHSYQIKNINPNLSQLKNGELIQTEVLIEEIFIGQGRSPTKILASNDSGKILLLFFNKIPPFIFNRLRLGSKHIICGKVQFFEHFFQMHHPEFILKKELESPLEPIYSLTYALTNKQLYYYICKCFELLETSLKDDDSETEIYLKPIIQRLKILHLNNFTQAIEQIETLWKEARKYLAQFELIANQASLKIMRSKRHKQKGHQFAKAGALQQKILSILNFELTTSQSEALKEIEVDQANDMQMLRLLQGDVGSGKTLVALLTMVNAVMGGYQCAFMAPTDLLAAQHFKFFEKALAGSGINLALLTGKTSQKERKNLAINLENEIAQILIGTHALFQENVSFKNLAYIVIDEQHKFGVEQRLRLISKALHPDILVMTATPIPRSLTLTMFGDMDVSSLKTKPKNRLPVITSVVSNKKIPEIIPALERKILQGEKIYWVCPVIESKGGEENDSLLKDVYSRFKALTDVHSGKVALLHGKMKSEEKDNIMEQFKGGALSILVATTVIEVGIDVSDATIIIIENAEQFGLAQLHQLRGRVGRGNLQSYCMLVYNPKRFSEIARNRLEIMRKSNDGFYIAEQDMLLRGSGEILGAKQSGEPEFFFANLREDLGLLTEANKIVSSLEINQLIHFQIKLFTRKFIDLSTVA